MLIGELVCAFTGWCARHRSPATVAFYRARLKRFCDRFNNRDLASLTSLEVDEHLAKAGEGMSDSTRHHDAVAVQHIENQMSCFVAFVVFCSQLCWHRSGTEGNEGNEDYTNSLFPCSQSAQRCHFNA